MAGWSTDDAGVLSDDALQAERRRSNPRLYCPMDFALQSFSSKKLCGGETRLREIALSGIGCIADDLLEHVQILHVAFAAFSGDAAMCLRTIVSETLRDLDETRFLQDLQMSTEIAVG